ncbi:hypothetical protein K1T71_001590 [Dendrolimus kikuchii]|uniref:Uncharacterized protein n=1 Tax=Dendrolimus kikuchii TaxID=765133 RepID=A0ACC1DF31_9NEOP|nr:hypothetical protein K1T71_001590 [Dendrolimus kikuchii]
MFVKYQVALMVLISLAFTNACQPPPCHWSDAKPMDNYFEQLANTLIAADRRAQEFCYNYGGRWSKEIFGKEFTYVFPVKRYNAADFTVMIKNRLLFVNGNSCDNIFAEVRILPDYLNVYGAYWVYENEEVVVYFPYIYNRSIGKIYKQCHPQNPQVITVQRREGANTDVKHFFEY